MSLASHSVSSKVYERKPEWSGVGRNASGRSHRRKRDNVYKGEGWLYPVRSGFLRSPRKSPRCKYSDLSGGLMEQGDQSPVLEQSLARAQDVPKRATMEAEF